MKQKILSMLLTVCMIVSLFAPITAFAAGNSDVVGGGEVETIEETASEAITESTPETVSGPASEANCDTAESTGDGGISILSGWEGGGSEFYTRIRLTATDRDGNPVQGAVYGLYRASDDSLVETLTTNSYGVAESSDVPVDVDYYLLEHSAPEGMLPNGERKDINLTEICAPSRVDETVVYDPITGTIKVIKEDEDGNPLSGIGFYVYRSSTWELVDTLETDSSGEAVSTLLPYGLYELYEYSYPGNIAGGGYYSVFIDEDGAVHEVYITNYYPCAGGQCCRR